MSNNRRFQDANEGAREARIKRAAEGFAKLSPREVEVMGLIAQGSTNKAIAEQLGISAHTVGAHRVNLMAKLDLHSPQDVTTVFYKAQALGA